MVSAMSTQTAITITWSFTTILDSRNETFIVMYGTIPGDFRMASGPVMSVVDKSRQNYSLLIMDLLPGIEYYYQINSTNIFESVTSEERNIRTMDASEFLVYFYLFCRENYSKVLRNSAGITYM